MIYITIDEEKTLESHYDTRKILGETRYQQNIKKSLKSKQSSNLQTFHTFYSFLECFVSMRPKISYQGFKDKSCAVLNPEAQRRPETIGFVQIMLIKNVKYIRILIASISLRSKI